MRSNDKDGNIIITLPIFNIFITINKDGGGSLTSVGLKTEDNDEEDELYNAAIDGIEALILTHAIGGVDVESVEYIDGIMDTVEFISNNF